MADLTGKRAVVTGASSGIGAAIATAMGAAGAAVLCVGRDRQRLDDVVRGAKPPGTLTPWAEDVTAEGAAERIVQAARDRLGGLDVLVNCAGIFEASPFKDADVATLDRQWAVHVRAPYVLTQAALGDLRGAGSVIFVSSVCGHTAFPQAVAYCATKGALEMMSKALAVDLAGEGIRVNTLSPGWVRTALNDELLSDDAYAESQVALTPLRRLGVPTDIAPAAVFLASDDASFVHGANLWVDGGFPAL